MTNVERTGRRDLSYSAWHRGLTNKGEPDLGFIDIDWIEFCSAPNCKRRLAIIELAQDNGRNDDKYAGQTAALGRASSTDAYLVLYHKQGDAIDGFRVRRLWPRTDDEFRAYTPDQWADQIFAMRTCHPLKRRTVTCATCGAPPVGVFLDGSARFACGPHPVLDAAPAEPDYPYPF